MRAGALSLLGLGIDQVEALRAAGGATSKEKLAQGASKARARGVIYIFTPGGMSHLDSFDLKPDAPPEIRGEFKPIATQVNGIRICEHLPLLAQRSQRWALCRSLSHSTNSHSNANHIMHTGRTKLPPGASLEARRTDWPAMVAVVGQVLRRQGGLPPAAVLPETLVEGSPYPGQTAGAMGSRWDPWVIQASPANRGCFGAFPEYDFLDDGHRAPARGHRFQAPSLGLPPGWTAERLSGGLGLLQTIEGQQRALEDHAAVQSFDHNRQRALSLLNEVRVRSAFDVRNLEAKVQDRYGRNSFGWSLLMARRLIEAGVSLVQVNLGNYKTWDTHQALFPKFKNYLLPPMDRALSALIDDLHDSGLLETTLVVMASEFGRTPRISMPPASLFPKATQAGREHWGAVQTIFFAGGGTRGGVVAGASDKIGAHPSDNPCTPEEMAATIYHALGIPDTAAWTDPEGRPHHLFQGRPIAGLS